MNRFFPSAVLALFLSTCLTIFTSTNAFEFEGPDYNFGESKEYRELFKLIFKKDIPCEVSSQSALCKMRAIITATTERAYFSAYIDLPLGHLRRIEKNFPLNEEQKYFLKESYKQLSVAKIFEDFTQNFESCMSNSTTLRIWDNDLSIFNTSLEKQVSIHNHRECFWRPTNWILRPESQKDIKLSWQVQEFLIQLTDDLTQI